MLHELLECLGGIDDPREPAKAEHRLVDVRAIAVCAVLAHAESFEDIALYGRSKRAWLGRFLELPGGIPSHDTLRRVLMLIDPGGFERGFLAWTRRAFVSDGGDDEAPPQIAVDGKALRRSFDRRRERTPLHPARAFATRSGLVLAQRRVAERRALHAAGVARRARLRGEWRPAAVLGHLGRPARPARTPPGVRGRRAGTAGRGRARGRPARPAPRRRREGHSFRREPRAERPLRRELPEPLLPDELGRARGARRRRGARALGHREPPPRGPRHRLRGGPLARARARARARPQRRRHLAVLRRLALNLVRADRTSSGSVKGKRKRAARDDAFMHRLLAA